MTVLRFAACVLSLLPLAPAGAQLVTSHAPSLEAARAIATAGEAEARRNGWTVAIAVVDARGDLVLLHRMDDVQPASPDIAIGKARTAARFRRPTKALADALAAGRLGLLGVDGLVPLEGGLPIVVDGRVVGAVGVSGMTGEQDAVVAKAGADAMPAAGRR